MSESKVCLIGIRVTPTHWAYLNKKKNYSEYIRELIEADIKNKKAQKRIV